MADKVFCCNCKYRFRSFFDETCGEYIYLCKATPIEPERNYVTGGQLGDKFQYCNKVNLDGCCSKYEKGENENKKDDDTGDGCCGCLTFIIIVFIFYSVIKLCGY
jgi:hypothetical protein